MEMIKISADPAQKGKTSWFWEEGGNVKMRVSEERWRELSFLSGY